MNLRTIYVQWEHGQSIYQSGVTFWQNWWNFESISIKTCFFRIDINPLWQSTLSLVSSQTPKLCKLGWVWNPRQPIMLSTHQQQSEPRKLPPLLSTFTAQWFSKLTVHFSSVWLLLGCFWHIKDSTDMYCTNCIYIHTWARLFYLYLPIKGRTIFFWR